MLIPGLPPAGAQNDAIKSSREVKPSAASEPLHDAATPQVERRQNDRGRWPERRRRKRRVHTRQEQSPRSVRLAQTSWSCRRRGCLSISKFDSLSAEWNALVGSASLYSEWNHDRRQSQW